MDLVTYYGLVKKNKAAIPGDTAYVTALDVPMLQQRGGVVCVATRDNAARLLANGTHRLATPEEVQEHDEAQRAREQELAATELKRKQHSVLTISPEMLSHFGIMAAAPAAPEKKGARSA